MYLLFQVVSRICEKSWKYLTSDAINEFYQYSVCVSIDKVFIKYCVPNFVHELTAKMGKERRCHHLIIEMFLAKFLDCI
jgi:hypothetical protein